MPTVYGNAGAPLRYGLIVTSGIKTAAVMGRLMYLAALRRNPKSWEKN